MARTASDFACQTCGARYPRWTGKCAACGEWNTLVEEPAGELPGAGERAGATRLGGENPVPLANLRAEETPRIATGIGEFDRLLGGGLVRGAAVLLGGEPGVGKSTLLLQALASLAAGGARALYVTGEESAQQVKLRAERLGVGGGNLLLVSETDVERILGFIEGEKPDVLAVDSVQTLFLPSLASAPGSVAQVRECSARLACGGKKTGVPVILVGHVTKEGSIAGPKTLEHLVDTVLYFEGERFQNYRLLRAVKNRYGSTNELGVFEMTGAGLRPVANPSEIFLASHTEQAGSAVVPTVEGTRTFLVEIQALTSPAHYGTPERRVSGCDYNRVCMILAVLERRGGLQLGGQDVFVNVVGGVELTEPACDLGIALAVASSFLDKKLPPKTVVFGELGLGGEVRPVPQEEIRLKEAKRLGFTRAFRPGPIRTLSEALERLGG